MTNGAKQTLTQLLGKELTSWPAGADFIVQDDDGRCWPSKSGWTSFSAGYWCSATIDEADFMLDDTAVDNSKARVTREMWMKERVQPTKTAPINITESRLRIIRIDEEMEKLAKERDCLMEKIRVAGFVPILPGPQK